MAKVIPILKSGDCSKMDNYCTDLIHYLVIFQKFQTKLAAKRLKTFLETENLLTAQDCGFRKNRSAINHFINL
jgi:hypothetical protein